MRFDGELNIRFSWKVAQVGSFGVRRPIVFLSYRQYLVQDHDTPSATNMVASTYLHAGFGLVVDADLEQILHNAPKVEPTSALFDLRDPHQGVLLMVLPPATTPRHPEASFPIASADSVDTGFRSAATSSNRVLLIAGTGFDFDELWEVTGLDEAVAAGTVIAGWVSLA